MLIPFPLFQNYVTGELCECQELIFYQIQEVPGPTLEWKKRQGVGLQFCAFSMLPCHSGGFKESCGVWD